MKGLFLLATAVLFAVATTSAQDADPLWNRYPAISPDGSQIAFTYKGDLYLVPASGGTARPLTAHEAHDYMPVWSPDGSQIAFASDRYGNFDVFIVSVKGGEPRRLTYHSAPESPFAFAPDGQSIVFGAARMDAADSRAFPAAYMPDVLRRRRQHLRAGGRYISHVRSEDRWFWEAIDEVIAIGRTNRMPVQISHIKLGMLDLWGQVGKTVAVLDKARASGVQLTADIYPYTYWQSNLGVFFPKRNFSDRVEATFVARGMADANVEQLIRWPFANVCSDGQSTGLHPRGFGSFPKVLGPFVRDKKLFPVEEAVSRALRSGGRSRPIRLRQRRKHRQWASAVFG